MLPADLKNWIFKKKKKRFWVSLAKKDHLMHIYVSMQKLTYWFFTIRKIGKLRYTWIHFVIPFFFFFPITDLKKFRLCNVIQQIKKVWPYVSQSILGSEHYSVTVFDKKCVAS